MSTQTLISNVIQYSHNPATIHRVVINHIEALLNGDDIVDPTTPFENIIEATCAIGAAAITEGETLLRQLYASRAITFDDLYKHMSDKDYANTFAVGGKAVIKMMLLVSELKKYAALEADGSQVLYIPQNSKILVNSVPMSISYPIKIVILANGSYSVTYDVSVENPIDILSTNIISYSPVIYLKEEYLELSLNMSQFDLSSTVFPADNTVAFNQQISFNDKFSYARIYVDSLTTPKKWVEINTLYTSGVYDINKLTALLKVGNGVLTVSIPEIYRTYNLLATSVRVDIYTTLGDVLLDFSNLPIDMFVNKWIDYDTYANRSNYIAINSISGNIYYSEDMLMGGTNSVSFNTLKDMVIYGGVNDITAVLPSELEIKLKTLKYNSQLLIDNVTDKVYLANKAITFVDKEGLTSGVLTVNKPVIIDNAGGYYSGSVVSHNQNRYTVLNTALYKGSNTVSLLTDVEIANIHHLATTNQTALIDLLNSDFYFYSPFFYVVDHTYDISSVKAYHLSSPNITGSRFKAINTNIDFHIGTTSSVINFVNGKYELTLTASKPKGLSGVSCLLMVTNPFNGLKYWLKSTIPTVNSDLKDIVEFLFTFETDFDISNDGLITITNFTNSLDLLTLNAINLNETFDVIYLVNSSIKYTSDYDDLFYNSALSLSTYETISLSLGEALPELYTPIYDMVKSKSYLTYSEDIPARYTSPVYAMDGLSKIIEIVNGKPQFIITHNVGDIIYDELNNPVILHHLGDTILDSNNNPVPTPNSVYSIISSVGVTLIDARYLFVTNSLSLGYKDIIVKNLLGYLDKEIKPISLRLLEKTKLYFNPRGNTANIKVSIGGGLERYIPSVVSFAMTYFVTKDNLVNEKLKEKIINGAKKIIISHLDNTSISVLQLTNELFANASEFILGLNIDNFLEPGTAVVNLLDKSDKLHINEKLVILPNSEIDLVEDITILFKSIT